MWNTYLYEIEILVLKNDLLQNSQTHLDSILSLAKKIKKKKIYFVDVVWNFFGEKFSTKSFYLQPFFII